MDRSALLEQQHALLQEWISLLERGLVVLVNGSPEDLQAVKAQKIGLLQRWQALRAAPVAPARTTGNAIQHPEQEALLRRVRTTTRRAIQLNRQFSRALHQREQWVASRLQVLCGAAGATDVYSSTGHVAPTRLIRGAKSIA